MKTEKTLQKMLWPFTSLTKNLKLKIASSTLMQAFIQITSRVKCIKKICLCEKVKSNYVVYKWNIH